MRRLLFSCFAILCGSASAQDPYFPPLTGSTWETRSPEELGWCPEAIPPLLDYLEQRNSKAFMVLKDGRMVIEHYFGTFTQDSLWYWASAGKTVTAFMVGKAQEEGHLAISDATSDHLGTGWTSCSSADEDLISIRHQLSMTSGLDDGVADVYCTLPSCLECLAPAGTRWAYHNGPYTLLDGVIEAATGQTLNQYTNQKLLQPTGMAGAFYQSGYNNVFVSKPRSMARFGLLMLNNGNWNGTQVMDDQVYFNQMITPSQNINQSYGYLWWLNGQASFMVPYSQFVIPGMLFPNAPADMYAAMGKNGQFLDVVPSQGLVVVRMGNAPTADDVPFTMNDTIWQKLNDVMCSGTGMNYQTATGPAARAHYNVAEGAVVVNVSLNPKANAVLTDVSGRLVHSGPPADAEHGAVVYVGALPPGVYVLDAMGTAGRMRLRLAVTPAP
jgi:CubicO group peptidase (beta-lactamase class C family)